MRTLLSMLFFFFCLLHLNGQTARKTHLFGDKHIDFNAFINPTYEFSQIALQNTYLAGIRAGVIINKKLTVGLVYNYTPKKITLPETLNSDELMMNWSGLHLEYTLWPLQKIHLTFPLSVGKGQMKITQATIITEQTLTGDPNFLFAEPGMMVEINIWKYVKLGIGTSFRFTRNVEYNSITKSDLSGFAAVTSVKFGFFNYKRGE